MHERARGRQAIVGNYGPTSVHPRRAPRALDPPARPKIQMLRSKQSACQPFGTGQIHHPSFCRIPYCVLAPQPTSAPHRTEGQICAVEAREILNRSFSPLLFFFSPSFLFVVFCVVVAEMRYFEGSDRGRFPLVDRRSRPRLGQDQSRRRQRWMRGNYCPVHRRLAGHFARRATIVFGVQGIRDAGV